MELWVGCVAGALEEREFLTLLGDVGFADASIEPTRVYSAEDALSVLSGTGLDATRFAAEMEGKFMGAFIRATKPGGGPTAAVARPLAMLAPTPGPGGKDADASCCGPTCCA
jgi:hypothetical protein